MATISVTSTYCGDALKKYILACLLGGETLATNGISVQTNVKYKRKIKKLASSDIVQAGSCDFDPTSGITITEASLEPCPFKINEQICFEDVYQLWDSADMTAGLNQENLPQALVDALTEAYVKQFAHEVEVMIWQNDNRDCFEGFKYHLVTGGAVTGATSATTVANVVTLLNKAYALVPACVLSKPKNELVIFVSHKTLAMYEMNLATQGIRTSIEAGVPTLYGIELHAVSGFADDDMIVIGERANFYVGTDLMSDFNAINILDMRQTTGDEAIRFILKAKLDVAVAFPGEVVILY